MNELFSSNLLSTDIRFSLSLCFLLVSLRRFLGTSCLLFKRLICAYLLSSSSNSSHLLILLFCSSQLLQMLCWRINCHFHRRTSTSALPFSYLSNNLQLLTDESSSMSSLLLSNKCLVLYHFCSFLQVFCGAACLYALSSAYIIAITPYL